MTIAVVLILSCSLCYRQYGRMELVLVHANLLRSSSPEAEPYIGNDGKPWLQPTRDFLLSATEITQWQYEQAMGKNPSTFPKNKRAAWNEPIAWIRGAGWNHPVEGVTWKESLEFCNRLSIRMGLESCYEEVDDEWTYYPARRGFRLPTEVEWEYACRAGSSTPFLFEDDPQAVEEFGWYSANSNQSTHAVGRKKPNAFELYDMHGNVCEWGWNGGDFFKDDYDDTSPVPRPRRPQSGYRCVFSGGSWRNDASYFRDRRCYRGRPAEPSDCGGFRVALDVDKGIPERTQTSSEEPH